MKKNTLKKVSNTQLIILVILVISILFVTYSFLKPSPKTDKTITQNQQQEKGILPEATIIQKGKCQNTVLGIEISVENGWTCKTSELSDTDGFMELTSDFYSIIISNLGRGPYCGDGPVPENTDESCTTVEFFKNDKVYLTMYKSYGENKEIFGGIPPLNNKEELGITWISVKYKNMENREVTEVEKENLIHLFDTLELLVSK